jgi:hypothetical protein
MRVVRIFLLTLFSTLLLTASAMAGTSYVATNGNNSTGTIPNPFATIRRACLNSTVYADLTAGNHVTNDARTPRSGAYDIGANEY